MTKTDLARLWREVNGGNRWPSDVDAFVEALLKQPRCMVPPTGWTCTRKAGHSAPLLAVFSDTQASDLTAPMVARYLHTSHCAAHIQHEATK